MVPRGDAGLICRCYLRFRKGRFASASWLLVFGMLSDVAPNAFREIDGLRVEYFWNIEKGAVVALTGGLEPVSAAFHVFCEGGFGAFDMGQGQGGGAVGVTFFAGFQNGQVFDVGAFHAV